MARPSFLRAMPSLAFVPVLAAFLALLAGCAGGLKSNLEILKSAPGGLVTLASPIRLAPDSTWVRWSDYFPAAGGKAAAQVTSAVWRSDSLTLHPEGAWLVGQPEAALGFLAVTIHTTSDDQAVDETVHLPVFEATSVRHTFTFEAQGNGDGPVWIAGPFNGWSSSATPMDALGDGQYQVQVLLSNGAHPYQLVIDGHMGPDPTNPDRVDNGFGGYNSLMHVGALTDQPAFTATGFGGSQVREVHLQGPLGGQVWAWWENSLYTMPALNASGYGSVRIPAAAYGAGRTHLRIWCTVGEARSDELLIPLDGGLPVVDAAQLTRRDLHAQTMYFLMVDRFKNGDPANDAPTNHPEIAPRANNLGGDLTGVTQAIEQGYFERLGIGTIWVSPITRNPEGAWGLWQDSSTTVKSRFSGYHGYWPISNTEVDPRFGTRADFDNLVDACHDAGMNFLLDYVANHVHEQHPLFDAHPDWATELYLPDGSLNTERWDDHRLTTWFDTFLPTLDLERNDVAEAMSDSAAWWIENSAIDGFRHDATKHIPESFWRMLTAKVRALADRPVFQIGETYGSPELISSYISTGMLDAQFDFNHYDAAVAAFTQRDVGVDHLIATAQAGLRTYGAHHLMGAITGNQDRPRFTSLAEGTVSAGENTKLAGWTRDIQHAGSQGYKSMEMLMAYLMSMPGIPCIYYGDELAYVGGNDPDNRRMMRLDNWTPEEKSMFDLTARWTHLRRERMELMFGQTQLTEVADGVLEIRRDYMGMWTLVRINTTTGEVFVEHS
jgi:cyclomaltodextrinase